MGAALTVAKTAKVEKVLCWYDGPQLMTMTTDTGEVLLVVGVCDEDIPARLGIDFARYLVFFGTIVSVEALADYFTGKVDLLDTMKSGAHYFVTYTDVDEDDLYPDNVGTSVYTYTLTPATEEEGNGEMFYPKAGYFRKDDDA